MLNNPHDHTGDLVKWFVNHWVILGGTISTIIGSISYILHQKFATISALEKCKEQTVGSFQKALDSHERRSLKREADSHVEIKNEIAILTTRIGSVDGKLDQLKNMLLQKEWTNK